MNKIKRIIDVLMLITLMCLMSYQITGEVAHEWIGISMVILVIIHQILNIKWYTAIMKGKYKLFRLFNTIINILLIASFICTAISGISMSNYAVPFLYSLINVNTARVMHLAFSYWSFILMGMHLGMHMGVISTKIPKHIKKILTIIIIIVAGYGFSLFLKSGIIEYILFKTHFAFLDYEKEAYIVFIENLSMLTFFAFIGSSIVNLIRNTDRERILIGIINLLIALIIGLVINQFGHKNETTSFSNWTNETFQNVEKNDTTIEVTEIELNNNETDYINEEDALEESVNNINNVIVEIDDGYIKIDGGSQLKNDIKIWLKKNNLINNN